MDGSIVVTPQQPMTTHMCFVKNFLTTHPQGWGKGKVENKREIKSERLEDYFQVEASPFPVMVASSPSLILHLEAGLLNFLDHVTKSDTNIS